MIDIVHFSLQTPTCFLRVTQAARGEVAALRYNSLTSTWLSVDPMSDKYPGVSPYVYCAGNPVRLVDPDGREIWVTENDNGTYTVVGGILNKDKNIYVLRNGEKTNESIGEMLTTYSFFNNKNEAVVGSIINLNDASGQEFLANFEENTPELTSYVFDKQNGGQTNGNYDFKNNNVQPNLSNAQREQYNYRGMPIIIGGTKRIASARDIGNYAAGFIAGKNGIPKFAVRIAFDLYNGGPEPKVSKSAQNIGYAKGKIEYELCHPQSWK